MSGEKDTITVAEVGDSGSGTLLVRVKQVRCPKCGARPERRMVVMNGSTSAEYCQDCVDRTEWYQVLTGYLDGAVGRVTLTTS